MKRILLIGVAVVAGLVMLNPTWGEVPATTKYKLKMMKAKTYEGMRDYKNAEKIYDEMLGEYSIDNVARADIIFNKTYVKYATGRYKEAIEDYSELIKKHEKELTQKGLEGSSRVYLGYSYVFTQEYEKAEEIFQEMLNKSNGKNYNILYSLGEVYHYWGKTEQAISTYEKAIQVYKEAMGETDPYGFVPLVKYHTSLCLQILGGDYNKKAIEILESIYFCECKSTYNTVWYKAKIELSYLYHSNNDKKEIRILEELYHELDPNDLRIYEVIYRLLQYYRANWENMKIIKLIERTDTDFPDSMYFGLIRLEIAKFYIDVGEYDKALKQKNSVMNSNNVEKYIKKEFIEIFGNK